MSPFLVQQIANGIMIGSIYALIAMGVAMIYGVMNVPDFALGAKAMLGGYVAFLLTTTFHQAYGVALIGSILALALVGVGVERWIFRPLAGAPAINGFISSFGLLLVLENFALLAFGSSYRRILSPFDRDVVQIFGASLTMQRLLVVVVAIAVMIGLHLFIRFTTLGTAIRAVAQNRRGALLCGIHTERIAGVTMAIGSALAGVAGALIGPIAMVYPSMGETLIVKAFVITILGGMGSIVGAIVGGYILGLIEALGAMYISVDYKDAFAFAVLVLVLTVRPQGLFGKAAR
ncbi:MAG: branched-chain amino acid ABC transporter permease [Janthinobacterium lividum]